MKGARSDKANKLFVNAKKLAKFNPNNILGAKSDRTVSITNGRKRLRKAITGAANATKRAKAGRGRKR